MHDGVVISVKLAIRLREAGVTWEPAPGDRFVIPDRDLDDQTFVLSDMIVQVHELPRATVIGFNGTTEWALDDIERDEAIWLPREDQLRGMLGDAFSRLDRDGDAYRVTVRGQPDAVSATAEDAYGQARPPPARRTVTLPASNFG
jgi:hypothetical protein